MAEGEERRDARALVVPVADVEAFAVDDREVLAGPVVECGCVLEAAGECALWWKRDTSVLCLAMVDARSRQTSVNLPGVYHWDSSAQKSRLPVHYQPPGLDTTPG